MTFKWKDYRIKGRDRLSTMTLDAAEFIRRFLLHVLPSGFRRRNPGRERSRRVRRRSCPALQPFPQALPGCPAATGQDPSDEPPDSAGALDQRRASARLTGRSHTGALRAAKTIGRPLGSAAFLNRLAALTGRDPVSKTKRPEAGPATTQRRFRLRANQSRDRPASWSNIGAGSGGPELISKRISFRGQGQALCFLALRAFSILQTREWHRIHCRQT